MDGERIDEIFARIDLWGMDVRTNIFLVQKSISHINLSFGENERMR